MILLIPYVVKHTLLHIVSTNTSRSTHASILFVILILTQRKQCEGECFLLYKEVIYL